MLIAREMQLSNSRFNISSLASSYCKGIDNVICVCVYALALPFRLLLHDISVYTGVDDAMRALLTIQTGLSG